MPSRLLRRGGDFTVVTYGINVNDALKAADVLKAEGIDISVLKLDFIKPIDFDAVTERARNTGGILVLEECSSADCVGTAIAAHFEENGIEPERFILRNLGDRFIPHGAVARLREEYGIDAAGIAKDIKGALGYGKEKA